MTFRSLIPFIAALGGVALMFWSFAAGISAALDAGGTGSLFWQLMFILAAVLVLATIVVSIINLVRKRNVVISVATLFVAVIPFVVVIVLAVSAAQGSTR